MLRGAGLAVQALQLGKGDIGMVPGPALVTGQLRLIELAPEVPVAVLRLQPGLLAGFLAGNNSLVCVQGKARLGKKFSLLGFNQQCLIVKFDNRSSHTLYASLF